MIWRFFLTIKNIKVLTPLTTPNPTPHPNPLLSYLVECDNFTPNLSSSLSKMFRTTYPGLEEGRGEGVGGGVRRKEEGSRGRGGGRAYIDENWSVYKDVYIGRGAGDYIISAIWFQSPAQFYPKIRSTSLAVLYRIYIMMQFNKGNLWYVINTALMGVMWAMLKAIKTDYIDGQNEVHASIHPSIQIYVYLSMIHSVYQSACPLSSFQYIKELT